MVERERERNGWTTSDDGDVGCPGVWSSGAGVGWPSTEYLLEECYDRNVNP